MFCLHELRIYVAKVASAKAWWLKLRFLIICYRARVDGMNLMECLSKIEGQREIKVLNEIEGLSALEL